MKRPERNGDTDPLTHPPLRKRVRTSRVRQAKTKTPPVTTTTDIDRPPPPAPPENPYLLSTTPKSSSRRTTITTKNHLAPPQRKPNETRLLNAVTKHTGKHDPCPYGNYPMYYDKRGYSREKGDSRLKMLEDNMFKHKRVLDIGCNTGIVSIEIALNFGAKRVVGIDIDRKLINRAHGNLKDLWSLSNPTIQEQPGSTNDSDMMSYFPTSMPHIFGPRPIPLKRPGFPSNLEFRAGDWVTDELDGPGIYDVVLALSITKWIHLNHGDSGMRKFFTKVHAVLSPGGKFIMEPQDYKGYAKRKDVSETVRKNYNRIRMYPSSFEKYLLENVGFESVQHVGEVCHDHKGFRRQVMVFTKAGGIPTDSMGRENREDDPMEKNCKDDEREGGDGEKDVDMIENGQ